MKKIAKIASDFAKEKNVSLDTVEVAEFTDKFILASGDNIKIVKKAFADFLAVQDEESAEAWLRQAVEHLGGGFHPDTRGDDYVDGNGEPMFPGEKALSFDNNMEKCFEILGEERIYDITLPLVEDSLSIRASAPKTFDFEVWNSYGTENSSASFEKITAETIEQAVEKLTNDYAEKNAVITKLYYWDDENGGTRTRYTRGIPNVTPREFRNKDSF